MRPLTSKCWLPWRHPGRRTSCSTAPRYRPPGGYSLRAQTGDLLLIGVSPPRGGDSADIQRTVDGTGFGSGVLVELMYGGSVAFPAVSTSVHTQGLLDAFFTKGTIAPVTYNLRAALSGGAFDMLVY